MAPAISTCSGWRWRKVLNFRACRRYRLHPDGGAFFVDFFPADVIEGYGVGGEIHGSVLPNELRPGAGAAVVEAFDSVQDIEHYFIADRWYGHHGRNERAAGVLRDCGVAAIHVVHQAVREVLECKGYTGGLVVFQHRQIDQLVYLFRDELRGIGPASSQVVDVVAGQRERHVHVMVRS